MDDWLYYDVTHALHAVCNPTSVERVDELGGVLQPEIHARRRKADEIYLRWGRQHLGFAIWVLR